MRLTGRPHPSWPCLDIARPLCFQLALTVMRQTGGLGISIAGGRGSTPYKGDDEVRPCPVPPARRLPDLGEYAYPHTHLTVDLGLEPARLLVGGGPWVRPTCRLLGRLVFLPLAP